MPFDYQTMDNDYAILKLITNLTFNENVHAACLPNSTFAPDTTDQTCFTSGWGGFFTGSVITPKYLQWVDVLMVNNTKCSEYYGPNINITDAMICAGNPQDGKGICLGDAGGPLVCEVDGKAALTGIASWGFGCGEGNPDVYSRVTKVLSWIKKNMVTLKV